MKRYLKKIPLKEARSLLPGRLGPDWGRKRERLGVTRARGRILAEEATALFSSPSYHASAMDGFAVEARLTHGASESRPVDLKLGVQAKPVDTGDPLPPGTDAVIMAEDAHLQGDRVRVYRSWSAYENVRLMGEDVVAGEVLLPAGKVLTPFDIGLCLAGGVTQVWVRRRPVVALIPTGDELINPGAFAEPGKIVEFNSAVLSGLTEERGGEPLVWPIIPDDRPALTGCVREAALKADIIVVNAGSSAGRDDLTSGVFAGLGELLAHGVSVVPGKPTALALVGGKPAVGLPGYPASAAVSFEQFVLPLIDLFLGWEDAGETRPGSCSRDLPSRPGHVEFIRGQAGPVGGRLVFNPLPRGASLVSSCARANALAEIPAATEGVERGEEVAVRFMVPSREVDRSLLLAGSHDLCLEVLRQGLLDPPGRCNLLVSTQGSLGGLVLLAEGFAHLATCHLLDPATGEYNLPYIRLHLPGREVRVLRVAMREQGLMIAKGNPKGINGLADLARDDVGFVNRQRGSGTRILLDHLLAGAGIDPGAIRGYRREEVNHMTAAAAVAGGLADAALGILSAALAVGLDFIPLAREPFDLVIPAAWAGEAPLVKLADIVASAAFRRRLEAFGGYDASVSGHVLLG